ncbi:hypothetical protein [Roseateles oligotrophus]|uniref:Uncharacterized protein n=1 Tax=Roseateles oligotrophus TaxID=1769250 RepID=A0ABT2Y9C5_9BURK|nr:hypothetical protein [Roseateles oligotrophus]MCV2366649.1 hypothetical protein [Roseateles oligotrophus]
MNDDNFFAPVAFKPDEALAQAKRALRDIRSLSERNNHFSLQGQVVLELTVVDKVLRARLAKRPARSPDWELRDCKNSAELRALQDEIKRRVARWTDETV